MTYWKNKESYETLMTLNNDQFYEENDIQYKW